MLPAFFVLSPEIYNFERGSQLITDMKRILTTLALAFVAVFAFAQSNSILRNRIEIVEVSSEENNIEMEVFYMHDESPRMYYLSVGDLGIGTNIVQVEFDPVFELFIPLGNDLNEAVAKLEEIKALFKMPRLEETEIMGCFAALYPNENLVPIKVTSRRFIFSKLLEFSLPTGTDGLVRATYIYKNDFGSLLGSVKIYKKLHPKE